MRRILFIWVAALALMLTGPVVVRASWLSEALHAYLDRDDYSYYAYPPPTEYYAPGYNTYYGPTYTTVPGYVYYGGPYYRYVPHRAWYGGARHWDHWGHEYHEHHGHHEHHHR